MVRIKRGKAARKHKKHLLKHGKDLLKLQRKCSPLLFMFMCYYLFR